jgi:hypothetical protein
MDLTSWRFPSCYQRAQAFMASGADRRPLEPRLQALVVKRSRLTQKRPELDYLFATEVPQTATAEIASGQ